MMCLKLLSGEEIWVKRITCQLRLKFANTGIAEPPFSLDNFNVCTISTQQKKEFWNPFFGLWLETPPAWWSFVHNSSSGRWQTWASNFVGKQPSSFCFYNQKIRILGSFALEKETYLDDPRCEISNIQHPKLTVFSLGFHISYLSSMFTSQYNYSKQGT